MRILSFVLSLSIVGCASFGRHDSVEQAIATYLERQFGVPTVFVADPASCAAPAFTNVRTMQSADLVTRLQTDLRKGVYVLCNIEQTGRTATAQLCRLVWNSELKEVAVATSGPVFLEETHGWRVTEWTRGTIDYSPSGAETDRPQSSGLAPNFPAARDAGRFLLPLQAVQLARRGPRA